LKHLALQVQQVSQDLAAMKEVRAANLLIREHGANANRDSARLQDLMLDRGDDEGPLVWGTDQAGDRGAARRRHRASQI
jgi:hypothetical protein